MNEDKSVLWGLRLSLILYIPVFYFMFNAEHYHVFWKSVIALPILMYLHIYWYIPVLMEYYRVQSRNELYLLLLEKYKKHKIMFIVLCFNGILQTMFLLLAVGKYENRVRIFLFPNTNYKWLEIYDLSEYFTIGVIPFLLYYGAKYWKNTTK
jgi:hypothetical protein